MQVLNSRLREHGFDRLGDRANQQVGAAPTGELATTSVRQSRRLPDTRLNLKPKELALDGGFVPRPAPAAPPTTRPGILNRRRWAAAPTRPPAGWRSSGSAAKAASANSDVAGWVLRRSVRSRQAPTDDSRPR